MILLVGVIKYILDDEYYEKLKELRPMIESEIGSTLNDIPDVKYSNVEIIALILAFLAIIIWVSITIFAIYWIATGLFVIYLTYQFNSRNEYNHLFLEEGFKRGKKKISTDFNFIIDIPKKYRWFSDISLLIQKIRIVKYNPDKEGIPEKCHNYLWAAAFSKNAINSQMGYLFLYLTVLFLYFICAYDKIIELNIVFVVLWLVQFFSFWYVCLVEGHFRHYVEKKFYKFFLIPHIIWIMSILLLFILSLTSYSPIITQQTIQQNILIAGLIGLLQFFLIMLVSDFFTSYIIFGMMNDKLEELYDLKKSLDYQIYHKNRLIEDPDQYLYDFLIAKAYRSIKRRYLLFGQYLLEPNLTVDEVAFICKSEEYAKKLKAVS